jgi:hypothetical protein
MPPPQFIKLADDMGFDETAVPRWQTIALGSGFFDAREVQLQFGDGMTATSQDQNIATIAPAGTEPGRFLVQGKNPGITFIDVFDPNSATSFPKLLEVDVKGEKRVKIAYQFVDKTSVNQSQITGQVHTNLTINIYEPQANIVFDMTRAAPIMVTSTLRDIIFELRQSSRRMIKHREWDELTSWGDRSADINVFFMEWDGRPSDAPSEILAQFDFDKGGFNIVCPDGMTAHQVERALGHEIGRFFGCFTTNAKKQKHQLMFRTFDYPDLAQFVRSGDYQSLDSRTLADSRSISKDCANLMNPTI